MAVAAAIWGWLQGPACAPKLGNASQGRELLAAYASSSKCPGFVLCYAAVRSPSGSLNAPALMMPLHGEPYSQVENRGPIAPDQEHADRIHAATQPGVTCRVLP